MMTRPSQRRILMTLDAVGGVWRYAMELAASLKLHRYDTLFAGFGPEPSAAQVEEAQRIGELVWQPHPLDWMVDDERELDGIGDAIEAMAEAHDVDLLHLNLPSQAANLRSRRPVLVVSHSCVVTWWHVMREEPLPTEWHWKQALNERGFTAADAIVSPSESHASLLRTCYQLPREISVVYNAMESELHGSVKEPFVLAAGRWWDESKNARILDQAARESSWEVELAGSTRSPSGGEVEISHATQLGELSHDALIDRIRHAAIVVSPSLYEPFGLLALEGARAGAALALADIPTYRELWDDCALFFDPRDGEALVSVLTRYARDHVLRKEMGRRALQRSRTFTPVNQAAAMAHLYEFLITPAELRRARSA